MNASVSVLMLLVSFASGALAGEHDPHRLIRIHVPDRTALAAVWGAGLDHEGATGRPGGWMEFVAGPEELRELERRGLGFEIVEPDLAAAARKGLAPGPMDALGFGEGSMGGYYTEAEVAGQLDSMQLLHPGLIDIQVIGYSLEGRPIRAARISDNPASDEPWEPEVLYTALTHAREPAGMMTLVYFMWWLLEEYGNDPDATYLVNNRQIWFIPVVNPDGYVWNETTNPSGGGFWRKNRRDNGNGTRGVDLNRNYGPDYMWNAPNGGSSTNTGSDTYRGTAPFSEPETQTIDSFLRLRSVRACLNYHTHGNLLIYPYGYLSAESPDSARYRALAFDLTRVNRYASGTDQQTVNYSTRGNSDDYMYGDTTKFRTYAMTPEVGTAFWPPSSQILPMVTVNLPANIRFAYLAGGAPGTASHVLSPGTASAGILAGEPFALDLTIDNRGLDSGRALTVSWTTPGGVLLFDSPQEQIHRLAPGADTTVTLSGAGAPGLAPGVPVLLIVAVTDAEGYARTDTIRLYSGVPVEVFADGAESGISAWTAEGSWGLSGSAFEGALSFHDSPAGSSPPWSSAGITTAAPVNLTGVTAAVLRFRTRWAIEPAYDMGVVKVSSDGGGSWTVLTTARSNPPSGRGVQASGVSGYDAYSPGPGWLAEEADLTPWAGESLRLRFELLTDGADSRDGWYLDEISVTGYRGLIPGSALGIAAASLSGASLTFGEIDGAGDGIDSAFGEAELPPPPAPGTFDARWAIAGTNGSLADIRAPLPTTGDTNVFALRIAAAPSDFPLAFAWERDFLPPGSWRISASRDGAAPPSIDMWTTEEVTIPSGPLDTLFLVHAGEAGASLAVGDRWNLVSIPVRPADSSVATLFPSAHPAAWSYEGVYVERSSISPGTGYWLRHSGAAAVTVAGAPLDGHVVENPAGAWRIVGAPWCPIARVDLCGSCPSPPVLFGYRNGYYLPDTLVPGEAYWYRGVDPLELDCRRTGATPAGALHAGAPPADVAPGGASLPGNIITIADASGGTASLRVGGKRPAGAEPSLFRLPPIPPGEAFDARFDSESLVEYVEEGDQDGGAGITVSNARGPLTVTWRRHPAAEGAFALLVRTGPAPAGSATTGSETVGSWRLEEGVPLVIPEATHLRIVRYDGGTAPAGFRLLGNYPNPFNGSTAILFDLPAPARVSLRVSTIAGQETEVSTGTAEYPAGRHRLNVDAGALPSGVYFYTLGAAWRESAGSALRSGKFLLLR